MLREVIAAAALALLAHAPAALACGHCVEDKIAAVYDHGAITQAMARGEQVAFFAIDGDFPAVDATRKAIEAAVRSIDGVDRNSVRVSLELASLSLSFKPARISYTELEKALGKKLADRKLKALPMKLVERAPAGKSASR
jgi:hypothetical protein